MKQQAQSQSQSLVRSAEPCGRGGYSGLPDFELRFDSLFVEGRGLSFPCDAQGRVDLTLLGERARANYLRACAVIGREYRTPAVRSLPC